MEIDLTKLYKNNEEFEKELHQVEDKVNGYKDYQKHLYDSPEKLYEFLTFDVNISQTVERLYLYAHINNDINLSNPLFQKYLGYVLNLFSKISEITSFVVPELLTKDIEFYYEYAKKYPKLLEFENNIKSIFRQKKLVLSENEEKIISLLESNYDKFEATSEYLLNTDLSYGTIKDDGNKIKLNNSNYSVFLESSSRKIRKEAFTKFNSAIKSHENTLSSLLSSHISNDNKIAKIRKFDNAMKLSLYRNDIDDSIYEKHINNIHNKLDTFYKYYDLKKKILNVKTLHLYDTYANISKDYNKKYTYEEAKNLILKSLSVLGKDYIKDLNRAFDENWIDYETKENKRSGGYCTSCYLTHPYVVINYEKKLDDVSTLAHELGHAMHFLYAMQNNTYQDYNYSIFVAEVASQVNEIILTDYIYKNSTNKDEKKYLLDQMLNRFKATVIRQTMFAEFEYKMHQDEQKGIVLTNEYMTNEYYKLNELYFGKNVKVDELIKYEAYRIPHFYYNFYVYQYATGYLAALTIANNIINGKEQALDNYLKFLKLGSTKDPVTSLKIAGVDITQNDVYDDAFKVFEKNLNALEELQ